MVEAKFKVGYRVRYINDYGVDLGIKTIIKIQRVKGKVRYFITPTNTKWYSVPEDNLHMPS